MERKMYVCPICKTEYLTPVEMANCILKCNEKSKEEIKRKLIIDIKDSARKSLSEVNNIVRDLATLKNECNTSQVVDQNVYNDIALLTDKLNFIKNELLTLNKQSKINISKITDKDSISRFFMNF